MALGVMHAAHQLGKRVPEDIAVVGVDDLPESSHFWPPLSTVRQPLDEAGELAVATILQVVGAARRGHLNSVEREPQVALLQPSLIVRGSSLRVGVTAS
jgi:DNA-binding LacI/PurR family transcriptional regulator